MVHVDEIRQQMVVEDVVLISIRLKSVIKICNH